MKSVSMGMLAMLMYPPCYLSVALKMTQIREMLFCVLRAQR